MYGQKEKLDRNLRCAGTAEDVGMDFTLKQAVREQYDPEEQEENYAKSGPVKADSEIQRETGSLEKFSMMLHESISKLEKRIEPILFVLPERKSTDTPRPPRETILGGYIGQSNDRLLEAYERLRELTNRIAL